MRVADGFLADGDLLEILLIHKGVLFAIVEQILISLLVELDALQHVARPDAFVQLGAVADVLQLDLKI